MLLAWKKWMSAIHTKLAHVSFQCAYCWPKHSFSHSRLLCNPYSRSKVFAPKVRCFYFLNVHRPRKRSVFDHIKCSHRVSPFLLFDLLVSFLWSGSVRLSTKESLMLTLHWASKQERYLSSGAHTHRLLWGRLENCLFPKLFHRSVYCPASEALADTIRCLLGMLVRSAWPCDRWHWWW